MMTYFIARTRTPPEHCHADRLHLMTESILQQLGFAAFTTACRRRHRAEDAEQVLPIAMAVEHHKVTEQPVLQRITLLMPLRFQCLHFGFYLVNNCFLVGNLKCQMLFHAMQFGFQKLRTAYHVGCQLLGTTFLFAFDSGLESRNFLFRLMHNIVPLLPCLSKFSTVFKPVNTLVECRYACLMLLEIAIWLQIIKHCRHKIGPIAASTYLSTVACKIAEVSFPPDNEHAKHLSLVYFGFEVGRGFCYPALHFVCSCAAKYIRFVVERIVHADRNVGSCG